MQAAISIGKEAAIKGAVGSPKNKPSMGPSRPMGKPPRVPQRLNKEPITPTLLHGDKSSTESSQSGQAHEQQTSSAVVPRAIESCEAAIPAPAAAETQLDMETIRYHAESAARAIAKAEALTPAQMASMTEMMVQQVMLNAAGAKPQASTTPAVEQASQELVNSTEPVHKQVQHFQLELAPTIPFTHVTLCHHNSVLTCLLLLYMCQSCP